MIIGIAVFSIGIAVGLPLAMYYPPYRDKPIASRLGLGALVGIGIGFCINALIEMTQLAIGTT